MKNTIEIKAVDKESAIKRALKILDINLEIDKKELKVIEKIKPKKKFFGLLGIENGLYEITVLDKVLEKKEEIKEEIKINKKINKEHQKEVKKEFKKETKTHHKTKEIKKEVKKSEKIEEKVEKKTEKINKPQENNKEFIKEKTFVNTEKTNSDQTETEITETILKTTKDLLTKMSLDLKVEVKKIKDKNYLVDLSGKDNAIIIGQKGKTLNNFEYILNNLLKSYRIEVDVEKFKEKRYETLRSLGKRMAEKVIKTGRTVRLNAMPARERKVIHEVVGKYNGLDTFSEGREPKRYIVIKKKR